jgi:hypothetical protein
VPNPGDNIRRLGDQTGRKCRSDDAYIMQPKVILVELNDATHLEEQRPAKLLDQFSACPKLAEAAGLIFSSNDAQSLGRLPGLFLFSR